MIIKKPVLKNTLKTGFFMIIKKLSVDGGGSVGPYGNDFNRNINEIFDKFDIFFESLRQLIFVFCFGYVAFPAFEFFVNGNNFFAAVKRHGKSFFIIDFVSNPNNIQCAYY